VEDEEKLGRKLEEAKDCRGESVYLGMLADGEWSLGMVDEEGSGNPE